MENRRDIRPILSALLSALLLTWAFLTCWQHRANEFHEPPWPPRVAAGEALLHGVWEPARGPGLSWSMPLSSVWEALHYNHIPARLRPIAEGALLSAGLLLVYSLGATLRSGLCGALAAAIAAALGLLDHVDAQEHTLYQVAVLLLANLVAMRAKPAAIGLGIALSLLIRSPLLLFPAVFCAFEWRRLRALPRRARILFLAPAVLIPLCVLLPWALMNRSIHGRWIWTEDGRARASIVAGAAGMVSGVSAPGLEEALSAPEHGTAAWAAREILRHPLRYARAIVQRAAYALSLHPWLFLLASAGAWRMRRGSAALSVLPLAAYFLGVHCLVAVLARYFAPLWPPAAAFAAAAFFPSDGSPRRKSGVLLGACAAPVAALGAFALLLSAVFPLRARPADEAAKAALARWPNDPWLWAQRGRQSLDSGKAAEAAGYFARALSLDPGQERQVDYAWALLAGGGKAAGLIRSLRLNLEERFSGPRGMLLLLIAAAFDSDQDDLAWELKRARAAWSREANLVLEPRGERDLGLNDALREKDRGLSDAIAELLRPWTPERRERVFLRLGGIDRRLEKPESKSSPTGSALELARAARDAGRSDAAAALYESAGKDPAHGLQAALELQAMGRYGRAFDILDVLVKKTPADAKLLQDRGILHALMGRPAQSAADLTRALTLDPSLITARLSLGSVLARQGKVKEAIAVYDAAPPGPEDGLRAQMINERNRLARQSGKAAPTPR